MTNPTPRPDKNLTARGLASIGLSSGAFTVYYHSAAHPDAMTLVMGLWIAAAIAFLVMVPRS